MCIGTQVIGKAHNTHLFGFIKCLYKALNGHICYAGSRCLQHTEMQFFKESFVPNDDDIFVVDRYLSDDDEWAFFTKRTILKCLRQCTYTPEQFSIDRRSTNVKKYPVFGYRIVKIYDIHDNRKIDQNISCQVIVVSHKKFYESAYDEMDVHRSFSRYIVKHFDLSLVQCFFDLTYMTLITNEVDESFVPYVKVQYLEEREDEIRNKRMTYYLSAASSPNIVKERLQKYEQRGYKCTKFVFRTDGSSLTISADGINLFRLNEEMTLSVSSLVWTHEKM